MSSNLSTDNFPIENEITQKLWKNFERELAHKLKPLPKEEREDIRLEILSHLYESASNGTGESEEVRLINAIERLGDPDDYLTPLVADILLQQKTKKGYPFAILESVLVTSSRGLLHMLIIMVLGFAYFHTMMIFVMAIMHIGNPDVGLWLYDSGGYALSFEVQEGGVQWLPKWFSLIGIVVSLSAYWLLNKILAWLVKKTRS
jgi:uncharacterized membrane protein